MKFIFFLGPGGVGKTTISAGAGLSLSRLGKTLVITVDPAKRLSSALGIPLDTISKISENLWATQIDKKKYFEEFLEEKGLTTLSQTNLFKIAADLLPSDEYSAFLKIVKIYENEDFDFVVVDTPPSTKFILFIDAPQKVLNLFETDVIKYLINIVVFSGEKLSGPISLAGKILGGSFVIEFAKFLSNLKDVFSDMLEIAKKAELITKNKNLSRFIGVSSPYDGKIDELINMLNMLEERKIEISDIFINRSLKFSEDGIIENSPESIQKFHKKLIKLSNNIESEVKKLKRFRIPIHFLHEYFSDITSLSSISDFANKSGLGKYVEDIVKSWQRE